MLNLSILRNKPRLVFCMIRIVFARFQSVSSLKARKKDLEDLKTIVRYINISEHLLV